jgi:hypothetical protein
MRAGGIAAGIFAVAASVGGSAQADDVSPHGIEVGLRSGYAIGLGNVDSPDTMSDFVQGAVPVWVDAGYRIESPNLFVGGYFQYGFGLLGGKTSSTCNTQGVSCSSNVLVYGLQAHYHVSPGDSFDPWIGYGIGMENMNINLSGPGGSGSVGLSGWDYAIFQLGGDFGVAPNLGIGPVVMFTMGQYGNISQTLNGQTQSQSVNQTALHEWLTLGIRGVYDIAL